MQLPQATDAIVTYDAVMSARTVRYSAGNEHNPGNPWGRSELVIAPDGTVRLDHYFSRQARVGSWTGRVNAAALEVPWSALDRAGFPQVPDFRPVAGATLRTLIVERDTAVARALVDWHQAPSLAGYAEAFDVLDGVVRQLSGESVPYPTSQPAIVSDIAAV